MAELAHRVDDRQERLALVRELVLDAGVAQACKPAEGFGTIARFSIPKIDACPAPFTV